MVVLTSVRLWCLAGGFSGSRNCLSPVAYHITLELTEQPPFRLSRSMGIYALTLRRPGPADSPTLVSGFLVLPSVPGQAHPGQVTGFLQSATTSLARMERSPDRTVLSGYKEPVGANSSSI